jgi:DNA-binding NtrC family response regulator
LNSIEIAIPHLRERAADIPILANGFLAKYSQKYQRNIGSISSHALDKLLAYQWPGNIRELDHLIERAVLMATSNELQAEDLLLKAPAPSNTSGNTPDLEINNANTDNDWAQLSMEQAEEKLISLVLRRFSGNAKEAANSLGYSKSAFYRRLEKFGI